MEYTLRVLIAAFFAQLLIQITGFAQPQTNRKPVLQATRLSADENISIDGRLNETVWDRVATASGFIQNRPVDGGTPSQKTEVKVLYDDKFLFVGVVAYDSAPDSIAATLFRRDGAELSDWVIVSIDSYNDNRTAFTFGVNPRGVQKDLMYINDVEQDVLWDAVWESETSITEEGWVAELRIPLSQLRFTSSRNIQQWGINFERIIARTDEVNYWARVPREEYGLVSFSGDLKGIENLTKPLRLEIQPYVSGSLTNDQTGTDANPFYDENEFEFKAGGDIKYGITSDFTLTGTVNPDFGQVEADPATINLTNFEIFFEERRPFFLEGSDIFAFGSTTSQNTFRSHTNFYSRRIGKNPSGNLAQAGLSGDFVDGPEVTTIAGAAKVSGKTDGGLSVGFLDAYTLEEAARYYDSGSDSEGDFIVEPAANYMVTRIKQDLQEGNAQIGGFLSSVNRNQSGSYLENYLHQSAYQAGVDGQYLWADRNWGVSGVFAGSQVNGSKEALIRTQTTSARYFNRTDSDYLSVDSSKTSLSGYFGEFSIGKYGGTGLRYSFTYTEMSPGYEVNDIGFQERADYRSPHFYAEYFNVTSEKFRYYLLWAYSGYAWNFDGDMIMNFYSSGAYFQFNNLWSILATGGFTGTFYNDRITRGGPVMRRPKDWNVSLELTSNTTKDFYTTLGSRYRSDASGEYMTTLYTSINYRPTSYIQLQFSPTYIKEHNTDQYQFTFDIDGSGGPDYIFSDSYLDIFYTELRLDWTFTSKLSLQTYMRPLLYTADFKNYKTFEEARTYNFDNLNDPDVESLVGNLDFNFKTVQGNAVIRYEYRPGSTIFLVWQQERESFLVNNAFRPLEGTRDIFKEEPVNIFLIKFSYWFGS